MKDTNLIIRIDEDLKNDFKKIVDENNFTVSSVVIATIKDIVKRKRIPINYYSYLKKKKANDKINIFQIKKALGEIIKSMNDNKVKKAYLFGSFARGDETKSSDIDIRIVEDEGLSLIDLSYINFELKNKLNREVDIVATGGLDTRFLERIKSEEICIYEK